MIHQLCKGASLQLWQAAAILMIGTWLMGRPDDHAACLQSINASPAIT